MVEEFAFPTCRILRSMAQHNQVPLQKVRYAATLSPAFNRNVSTNVGVGRLEAEQPVEDESGGWVGHEWQGDWGGK